MGPRALMELKYAIYDGLEMKLKVTKNATNRRCNLPGPHEISKGTPKVILQNACAVLKMASCFGKEKHKLALF